MFLTVPIHARLGTRSASVTCRRTRLGCGVPVIAVIADALEIFAPDRAAPAVAVLLAAIAAGHRRPAATSAAALVRRRAGVPVVAEGRIVVVLAYSARTDIISAIITIIALSISRTSLALAPTAHTPIQNITPNARPSASAVVRRNNSAPLALAAVFRSNANPVHTGIIAGAILPVITRAGNIVMMTFPQPVTVTVFANILRTNLGIIAFGITNTLPAIGRIRYATGKRTAPGCPRGTSAAVGAAHHSVLAVRNSDAISAAAGIVDRAWDLIVT
mgnify:CR=1 FL=1